jgi:uncharacterized protein DUF6081
VLKTETSLYDDMSKGHVDPSKWKIMSFPMGNGQNWVWEEPKSKITSKNGGLALTIDPFTRKHDTIHMFDDPKQLYGSTRTFPVSQDRVTVFEAEMGAETYRSNADDLQDAFAGLILMDFSTGMIFDFVTTGKKIGVIYERLLIPGITDEKTAFTYLIEAPFSGVRTRPEMMHNYTVRIDAPRKRAEWLVDGKLFFKAESIPVAPKEIVIGWGLFTLKPVDPEKGSVSVHGQGATGVWKNFRYSIP